MPISKHSHTLPKYFNTIFCLKIQLLIKKKLPGDRGMGQLCSFGEYNKAFADSDSLAQDIYTFQNKVRHLQDSITEKLVYGIEKC